jgi:hypothetical protein
MDRRAAVGENEVVGHRLAVGEEEVLDSFGLVAQAEHEVGEAEVCVVLHDVPGPSEGSRCLFAKPRTPVDQQDPSFRPA